MAGNNSTANIPNSVDPPNAPAPLTAREQAGRRMERAMFLEQGRTRQGFGALPPAPIGLPGWGGQIGLDATGGGRFAAPQPARKRFEVSDVRRLPVSVPPEVRHALARTNAQGRLLPQALSEILGRHPGVAGVALDVVPVDPPAEQTAEQQAEPRRRPAPPTHLRITALPTNTTRHSPLVWIVALADLSALHPVTRHPLLRAVEHASGCLRDCAHAYRAEVVESGE